ncbi:NupC/NupG family nucleoside CNT transporter [Clostridium butyricum]|uniref:Na+ dependent nucleoside transporter domain-containing protein n=1 Tax=Clostridium butyricum TaxID=1492 RepID=A0A2S7FDB9_CLOBU|nr:nucleoside transporter C-terminal domain-containing protein [Clostridium butyricum]APF23602.1 nucleoside recognition family protein [Clostridium butyricum]KHD16043.1 Na+ dependent nucleoside transporter domain-containing protein [Clostridium butyricum]MBS5982395.1 NupC/NupG family nucleoside CNT transporter [Clostridium butyricum]MBZ0313361.1 NupC/NupG family nucleoside CNT transporter [Clostridium butyricum]MCQ2013950.1 NupC/NupG family nucleoside CNT transporter [Clostridium butyricum]
MKIFISIFGIIVVLGFMYLLSSNRKEIPYKTVIKALGIQFVIAFLLVKFPLGRLIVQKISDVVTGVLNCGREGLLFVFGSLADGGAPTGFVFGIQTLGNIIFVSALVGALYYLGVIGFIVKIIGKAVGKVLGTSQVESFVAVANMFLGQTESPILVSKYLGKMTKSEIVVVLVSGMGSMSATIIGGYTALGIPMENLLIASALVPMGSMAIAKILTPEVEKGENLDNLSIDNKGDNANILSAISEGAINGMNTALAIGASLIAVLGLVAIVNMFLGYFGLSLEQIFSYVFAPLGFLMGLEGSEVLTAGQLLGSKLVLNEFVAFQSLGEIINSLSERTGLILSISLAGFANVSSIGVCISGIAALCPEKRNILAKLAFKSMLGGFAVSVLSGMIVGIITLL